MSFKIGKLTAAAAIEQGLIHTLAWVTNRGPRAVRARLDKVHGATLVRNALEEYWPVTASALGKLTVAMARDFGLHEEIAGAAQLSERTITQRLGKEAGNKLLANAFPEMQGEKGEDDEHDGQDDEDQDEEGDEIEIDSSDVPIPDRRVARVRNDSEAVEELARLLDRPATHVQRKLRAAHGAKFVRNVFPIDAVQGGSALPSKGLVGNRWKLVRPLGQGGFGEVWEAKDPAAPELGPVVLKFARNAESVASLRSELRLAYGLHHQNICAYRDISQDQRRGPFVILQHGGRSLEKLIKERGVLQLTDAIEILQQAAAGIDYAHSQNVLHQDIKPANILVQERLRGAFEVRISDFGISILGRSTVAVGGGQTVVATQAIGFTEAFASPEQWAGAGVSRKSDQYSLALVFCAMLEGEVFESPYSRRNFTRLSAKQNAAVERALCRDPSQRFASCTAFAEALG